MVRKIDVKKEWWDNIFAPSSALAVITTVDGQGRVNAAAFGTCTRVCHDPVYISFTCGLGKDTANNVAETGEFLMIFKINLKSQCKILWNNQGLLDNLHTAGSFYYSSAFFASCKEGNMMLPSSKSLQLIVMIILFLVGGCADPKEIKFFRDDFTNGDFEGNPPVGVEEHGVRPKS